MNATARTFVYNFYRVSTGHAHMRECCLQFLPSRPTHLSLCSFFSRFTAVLPTGLLTYVSYMTYSPYCADSGFVFSFLLKFVDMLHFGNGVHGVNCKCLSPPLRPLRLGMRYELKRRFGIFLRLRLKNIAGRRLRSTDWKSSFPLMQLKRLLLT